MGSIVGPSNRPDFELATFSARRSTLDVFVRRHNCRGRVLRTANGADESGGCAAVDSLARTDGARAPGCGKRLLFRLPLQLCSRVWSAHPAGAMVMAPTLAFKMDRDRFAFAFLLGLRSVQLVG